RIILQVLEVGRGQVQILSGCYGVLPSLVIVGLPRVDVEAGLNGAVEQIGFGKSEDQVALAAAEAGLHGERLAQAQEVVGAVIEAHEGSSQTADATLQSD